MNKVELKLFMQTEPAINQSKKFKIVLPQTSIK